MKVLALSYLFPNPVQPDNGVFVYHRLRAVQDFCEVKVIAPLQRYPFQNLVKLGFATKPIIGLKENMEGLETWYPKFQVIPRYLKLLDALSYYFAVKPVVKKLLEFGFKFDVIDTHWTYPDILATYLLSRQYKKPFIITVRGREALYLGERGGRKIILDWCLRRADAVVTLSSELASLVESIGVHRTKIHVILNGVDKGCFHQIDRNDARRKLKLSQNKKIIIAVGRLTEAKGHQHIIKALPDLATDKDVELHIIGGLNRESDYSIKLNKLVNTLGLRNVYFHNSIPQKQLLNWYNAADLFCLASKGEGCPNVVIESLSCGTPVVITNVGAVPDLVENNVSGIIVESIDQLTEKISNALEKKWNNKEISRKARNRTWGKCSEEVVNLYRSLIDG